MKRECYKKIGRLSKKAEERFWRKVDKSGACWLWNGVAQSEGYGEVYIGGVRYLAHRIAWRIVNGPIPRGKLVLHECDNRACVKPKHLFLGTHKDNFVDAVKKNRIKLPFSNRKLTLHQVKEIRRKYVPWKYSQYRLAREYGVSRGAIKDIVNRRNWK